MTMVIRHTAIAVLALAAGCRLHFDDVAPLGDGGADVLGDDATATATWTFGERDTSMVKNVTTDATIALNNSRF